MSPVFSFSDNVTDVLCQGKQIARKGLEKEAKPVHKQPRNWPYDSLSAITAAVIP
jgi:hypothetical protein